MSENHLELVRRVNQAFAALMVPNPDIVHELCKTICEDWFDERSTARYEERKAKP